MHKLNPAETHTSNVLKALLAGITPEAQAQTNKRMMLADAIFNAMQAKGWSKQELAERMGQKTDEVERWLSGSYQLPETILQKLRVDLNLVLPD